MFQEFKSFIARGNVIDLAVGIIIGAAFTAIVSSMVDDLLNPILGLVTGGIDFTNKYVVLSGDVPAGASLQAARDSGAAVTSSAIALSTLSGPKTASRQRSNVWSTTRIVARISPCCCMRMGSGATLSPPRVLRVA